jgi:hypothetical protein
MKKFGPAAASPADEQLYTLLATLALLLAVVCVQGGSWGSHLQS